MRQAEFTTAAATLDKKGGEPGVCSQRPLSVRLDRPK